MLLTAATCALTLYFALFLGISGLAKIDRPLRERGRAGSRIQLIELFFAPMVGRVLGAFEIAVAFFLASAIRIEIVAIVNAGLFGMFLLFKLLLVFTKRRRRCGCFGAHELHAIDSASVVSSFLILGLAVLLAMLVQRPSASTFNWIGGSIFFTVFGWTVVKMLSLRRLENEMTQRSSVSTVIE